MAELKEFKRMNFFTGFFTTADDWNQGQEYHQGKRRLHNRGLHTPGVIRGVENELRVVVADGGLNLEVQCGAALDREGNEIYLVQPATRTINPAEYTDFPQTVYITVEYREDETDYVENVETPEYSGPTRVTESPDVLITTSAPDNQTILELARIKLESANVTEITPEMIDRSNVVWAGSTGRWLSAFRLKQITDNLTGTLDAFAALTATFPVVSVGDVRHLALTAKLLACMGCMGADQILDALKIIAELEQKVGEEIVEEYGEIGEEITLYQGAVEELLKTFNGPETELDDVLFNQELVIGAAERLAEAVLEPEANAGHDQTVLTSGVEATVALDASGSMAFGGREITKYRWKLVESQVPPPVADAGPDQTIKTSGDEATLELDASESYAFGGQEIERYRWQKKG